MPDPIGKKLPELPKIPREEARGIPKHERIVRADQRNGPQLFDPMPKRLSLADIHRLGNGEAQANAAPIKFRFAPSPTGKLHIGGARTALMNFLAAKKLGGEFVLRIEDTDVERSKPEHTEAIKESLKWLGIHWDGDVVVQSQRTALHQAKVKQLVDQGKAYKDASGAVFFKMPTEGALVLNDEHKGKISVNAGSEGMQDFVIQRADGNPTFLLANVVDDGEDGINHIIRGDDHVNNALKQIPLIRALGYQVPKFWHVPLIHGDDGQKLSKRHGAQSTLEFRDLGYPAEAVVNHLARLGMSINSDHTLPLADLAKAATMKFANGPAKIGFEKLDSRSKRVIAGTDAGVVAETIKTRDPALAKRLGPLGLEALASGVRGRAQVYDQAVKLGWLLLEEPTRREDQAPLYASDPIKKLMRSLVQDLQKVPAQEWSSERINAALKQFNEAQRTSYAAYQQSLRWMLTGGADGFSVSDTLALLGPKESLKRLTEAADPAFRGSAPVARAANPALGDEAETREVIRSLQEPVADPEPAERAYWTAPEGAAPVAAKPVFDVVMPQVQAVAPVAPPPDNRPAVFRYAPTTKADMGVSGARIALLNYLAAKKAGGHLLVRFEDTDAEKAKPEGIQSYKDALGWLGIHYEGEPATQSQRKAVHSARADALIQAGKAYADDTGAVFFKMPKEGDLTLQDNVKGLTIAKATDEDMQDFLIRNADGTPSPLFASVVDDADSGVTRVIRAEANLKDALRAQPLYEALGHQPPQYWHIPGLKGDDGKKLQAPTISEMRAKGYHPLAVANHLVRLGLDDVKDPQTLPLDQLAAQTEFKFNAESSLIGLAELDKRNQEHK